MLLFFSKTLSENLILKILKLKLEEGERRGHRKEGGGGGSSRG